VPDAGREEAGRNVRVGGNVVGAVVTGNDNKVDVHATTVSPRQRRAIWAAVAAGLGVALRTGVGLPPSVRALAPEEAGLPRLPLLGLHLHRAEAEPAPAIARLEAILRQRLEGLSAFA